MNKLPAPMLLSCGLPPVSARLMKRIQDGLFIEMPEFLPVKLISVECNAGDNAAGQKQKPQEMITILKWVQCFGLYTAIVSHAEPEQTADLLGYQHLIINASQHCQEGQWMSYNRHFRLKASATKSKNWSSIDINIWNMTFPKPTLTTTTQKAPHYHGTGAPAHSYQQPRATHENICLYWNDDPTPNCPYPDCRYEHRCYHFICNPKVDNQHKVMFCSNKGK